MIKMAWAVWCGGIKDGGGTISTETAGLTPARIETHADVTLAKVGGEFTITASHLTVVARIPGADDERFQEIANETKLGCPVSRLLRANITLEARLEA